jgi:hypothetical protein
MPSGKQIGEYSLKITSTTVRMGPAGSTLLEGNCAGPATGFGTVLGTGTFVVGPGGKSGTFGWTAVAYLDDGGFITGNGQGTYESSGMHRWRTAGYIVLSNGRTVESEGELRLEDLSWTGKLFERA